MNILRHRAWLAALAALCVASVAAAQAEKPDVVILATGGTIAGAAATGTQSGYTSGAVTIDTMVAAVPGIGELAIKNAASFAIVERMRAGVDPKRACEEILARVVAKHPEVKTNEKAQLAFIAMNKRGVVGAAALRKQKKVFRYALVRGTKAAPALIDVKPVIS